MTAGLAGTADHSPDGHGAAFGLALSRRPWLLRATALCVRDDEVTSARRLPASGMIAAYCGSYGIACRGKPGKRHWLTGAEAVATVP